MYFRVAIIHDRHSARTATILPSSDFDMPIFPVIYLFVFYLRFVIYLKPMHT